MNAADLVAAVADAVAPVAEQLPASRWRETAEAERLTVRPHHVTVACPAQSALDGDAGFVARPVTVGPAASGAVLDRLLLGPRDPLAGGGPCDPATAFRDVLRDPPEGHWAWEWATAATREQRALLAAAVARRVSGAARMLRPWPPPEATHAGRRPPWFHPERPLRLVGGVDATLGRRDGTHTVVVVLTGDHGGATRDRLAYEAVIEALSLRRAPAVVLGILPDAGREWSLPVDDVVLAAGVDAVRRGAATALGTARADATGLARRAGPACRSCSHRSACADGEAWVNGPGRLRAGFLPPA